MKNFNKLTLVVLLAAMLIFSTNSEVFAYPFAIQLSDGANTVTVLDNEAGDSNPLVGAISYIGSIGSWITNVSTAITMPILGSAGDPIIDLNSINIGTGNLTIMASSYGFDVNFPVGMHMEVGGTTTGTAQFFAYHDDIAYSPMFWTGYGPDITTPIFTAGSFSGIYSGNVPAGIDGTTFTALTLEANIHHGTFGVTSFDAYASVPEPATLLLLGFGLVGLAGAGRKFKK